MRFNRSDLVVITQVSPSETDQLPRAHELGGLGLWAHRIALREPKSTIADWICQRFVGGPLRVMA